MMSRPLIRKAVQSILALVVFVLAVVIISSDRNSRRIPAIPSEFKAIESEDNIGGRWRYEWLRLHDPKTGEIPARIRERELVFSSKLPTVESRAKLLGKSEKTNVMTWNSRGPYNVGGRTRALAYDVSNTSAILAGGVSGGMWRSTDGGTSWTMTSSLSTLHSVSCLAQDTRSGHTSTWYYGTGELGGNSASGGGSDAYYDGDGIFKSTNGGASWSLLSLTSSGTPQLFDSFFDYIWNIAIDSSNSSEDELYAATYARIYRSTDGGTNWTMVKGGSPYSASTDVAVTSTGVVYATLSSTGASAGIWRSTDGTTWTNITPAAFPTTYGRIVIGVARSNENVVYFFVQGTNGTNGANQQNSHQFWKYTYSSGVGNSDGSEGNGGTWVNRGVNLPTGGYAVGIDTQGGYDMLIRVKPDNEDFVIVGGVGLHRSTDGFASTSNTTKIGSSSGHHVDQHSGMFKPGNSSVFLSGHDGGVSVTSDIAATSVAWTSLNNGYYTTQFYTVALDHGTNGSLKIIGGMQDNGIWETTSSSGTANWTFESGGDGAYCAISDGDGARYYSSQNSNIYRYVGANWTRIDPTGGTGYLFINPFVLDPNDNAIVYLAGGDIVWRNSDVTSISWSSNATTSTNWTNLTNTSTASTISALGISTTSANRLYYGTADGGVYRLDGANSGNPMPTDIYTGKGFPSGAYVSCIAVDRQNANNALVVFSNYSVKSLFFTSDGGSTWSNVSGNLEQDTSGSGNGPSCRWAAIIHGSSSTSYFVGTSTGLYSTTTLNGTSTSWAQEGSSTIGNAVVDMIDTRENDGTVVIGTHGSGVFSSTIPDPLPVEFVSFTASSERSGVRLQWRTITETNNYGFEIERREMMNSQQETVGWIKIGFVKGAGTSSSARDYSFTDNPSSGRYAYRIKQVDNDGTFKYADAVEIDVGLAPRDFFLRQNYPNPFNPATTLEFSVPQDGHVRLNVYNVAGEEVASLFAGEAKAGLFIHATFDGSHLASGVYFARLEYGDRRMIKKMLLLK